MNKTFSYIIAFLDRHDIYAQCDSFTITENSFNSRVASMYLHPQNITSILFFHIPVGIALTSCNSHIEASISTAMHKSDITEIHSFCEEYVQKFLHHSHILQNHVAPKLDIVNRQLEILSSITDKRTYDKYRLHAADELAAFIKSTEQICSI